MDRAKTLLALTHVEFLCVMAWMNAELRMLHRGQQSFERTTTPVVRQSIKTIERLLNLPLLSHHLTALRTNAALAVKTSPVPAYYNINHES